MTATMAPPAVETARPTRRRPAVRATVACLLDLTVLVIAGLIADALRFTPAEVVGGPQSSPLRGVPYIAFGLIVAVGWLAANATSGAYGRRVLLSSTAQFKTLGEGLIRFVAVLALTSWIARADIARAWSFYLLVLGVAGLAAGRLLVWRACMLLARRGVGVQTAIAIGTPAEIEELIARLRDEPSAGIRIIGAVMPPAGAPQAPPIGSLASRVAATKARLVIVAGTSAVGRSDIKAIGDAIQGLDASLLVVPELSETASTRLTVETVGTLPMLHVTSPELTTRARIVKAIEDRGLALVGATVTMPLAAIYALALLAGGNVRILTATDRVGLNGRRLRTWKFADNTPLIPSLGPRLRRTGLARWPELLSVVAGQLSLVGPRAAEPEELAVFGADARRRLSVRPGITGLSQLTAPAALSWTEMARLDSYYVQNWSVGLDLSLLLRAALRRRTTQQPSAVGPVPVPESIAG